MDRREFLAIGGAMLAGMALDRIPQLWMAEQDTTTFRFLADDPRFVYSRPCFSPSGDRVVYMRAPATDDPSLAANSNRSSWTLWTVPVVGGEHRLLFDDPQVIPTRPDWSSVSNRIAFTGMTDDGANLWLLDPETGRIRRVALPDPYRGSLYYPTWYPDGERVGITDYSSHTLLEVRIDRADVRALTSPGQVWVGMASVAPDHGRVPRIAFAGQRPGKAYSVSNNRIWIRQSDGQLHSMGGAHGRTPWWSPDGRYLAFSAVRGSDHPAPAILPGKLPPTTVRIYVQRISPGGRAVGEARPVSPPDHAAIHPKWHPSGQLLACTTRSLVSGRRGLIVLELADP